MFMHLRRETGTVLLIALLGVGGAVAYGLVQDQVTAHVCPAYFIIGLGDLFNLRDPTLIGLEWGVIGAWWAGLVLGIVIAVIARVGTARPPLSVHDLLRPTLVLQSSIGLVALIAGVIGGVAARAGVVFLTQPLASAVPHATQVAFLAVLWAQNAAYAAGAIGGMVLGGWTWRQRGQRKKDQHNGELPVDVRAGSAGPVRHRWEVVTLRTLLLIGVLSVVVGGLFILTLSALAGL